MKKNEKRKLYNYILYGIIIYLVVLLTAFGIEKTNIFVGSLVPVISLGIYYVFEGIVRRSR